MSRAVLRRARFLVLPCPNSAAAIVTTRTDGPQWKEPTRGSGALQMTSTSSGATVCAVTRSTSAARRAGLLQDSTATVALGYSWMRDLGVIDRQAVR